MHRVTRNSVPFDMYLDIPQGFIQTELQLGDGWRVRNRNAIGVVISSLMKISKMSTLIYINK